MGVQNWSWTQKHVILAQCCFFGAAPGITSAMLIPGVETIASQFGTDTQTATYLVVVPAGRRPSSTSLRASSAAAKAGFWTQMVSMGAPLGGLVGAFFAGPLVGVFLGFGIEAILIVLVYLASLVVFWKGSSLATICKITLINAGYLMFPLFFWTRPSILSVDMFENRLTS